MSKNKSKNIFYSIPTHIIRDNIEPYTRNQQPKELCNDIVHFKESIKTLHTIYCFSLLNLVGNDNLFNSPKALLAIVRLSWSFIEIDILTYLVRMSINIYDRLHLPKKDFDYMQFFLSTITTGNSLNVDTLLNTDFKLIKSRVYRIWGLMTEEERNQVKEDFRHFSNERQNMWNIEQ